MKKLFGFRLLAVLTLLVHVGCDNNETSSPDTTILSGTGSFNYTGYEPLQQAPVRVFYHIPEGDVTTMPVLFVLHGSSRNAVDYRNAWIPLANQYKVAIIAPEFSDRYYPGGNAYNLGNVFIDGDHPSSSTLHAEEMWTFSLIEPLFDEVKVLMENTSNTYDIYGHSAGAQFAHRFIMLKPGARVRKVVASSSGWYTVPDNTIIFPYGIEESPITSLDPQDYFSRELILQIGENDTDPGSAGLRHNAFLDVEQGMNRYERTLHFYDKSDSIARSGDFPFRWKLLVVPDAAHDFRNTISDAAASLYGDP
ncbi:hypothetical protein [Sinomicrobium sp. M5D2P17]